jgi:hypothetical protein
MDWTGILVQLAIACSKREAYPVLDLKPWKEVLGWM